MMDFSPIQLLAQEHGSENWIQLVVLLVMVLLSAVGGLFKRYNESRQRRERTGPAPSGQTTRATVGWRQKLEEELGRVRTEAARRTAREPEAERPSFGAREGSSSTPEPNVRPVMAKTREQERAARKAVAEAKNIMESALHVSEPAPEPVGVVPESHAGPTSTPSANRVLIDLSDPDALRRAIIQYEILGKPLGLRNLPAGGKSDRVS